MRSQNVHSIRLRRDPLASIVPGTLVAIAALHAAWALGWRWPGGSDQALADHVVGHGAELPPDWLTGVVAAMLLTGAGVVRAGAGGRLRLAAWAVAGVLLGARRRLRPDRPGRRPRRHLLPPRPGALLAAVPGARRGNRTAADARARRR